MTSNHWVSVLEYMHDQHSFSHTVTTSSTQKQKDILFLNMVYILTNLLAANIYMISPDWNVDNLVHQDQLIAVF